MVDTNEQEMERVRRMAERLDCFLEEDFRALSLATPGTVEAWRKRGQGPAYIRLGNRFLYPRKAVSEYLDAITRDRARIGGAAIL